MYEPIDREKIPMGVIEFEWKLLNRKAVATIRQCVEVRLHAFICGILGDFQKDCRHLKKDKGASKDVEPRKISEEKGTLTIIS